MTTQLPSDFAARVRGTVVSAAVGDALGWPQEIRSSIVGGQKARNIPPQSQFRPWERNSGGQYARYKESVLAGEYSDDTQLLIAVARACLAGEDWAHHLSHIELPAWTLYQRGAGRAVISAARAWSEGRPPWDYGRSLAGRRGPDQVTSYFNAGSNGAAMRIAPHAVITANSNIDNLLIRVVTDGITTHGHPRALIGAALHAVALRGALLRHGTLEYGDLLDALLYDFSWQDPGPFINALPHDWLQNFRAAHSFDITIAWEETVHEVREMLQIASRSLSRAALANDEQTLGELGCYDKSRNGSGTVTAVATAYLAARSAARPITGLMRAAFLPKADTDTLASMTASLLGAIHGTGWLDLLADTVQDSAYLHGLASQLADVASGLREIQPDAALTPRSLFGGEVTTKTLDIFRNSLFNQDNTLDRFIDGREIVDSERIELLSSGTTSVRRARLTTREGQTLIIDKITRGSRGPSNYNFGSTPRNPKTTNPSAPNIEIEAEGNPAVTADIMDISLRVSSINRSMYLYRDILNLPAAREPDGSVRLSIGLRLTELPGDNSATWTANPVSNIRITIRVNNFDAVVKRAMASPDVYVIGLDEQRGHEQLRMHDPDGHYLRIIPR